MTKLQHENQTTSTHITIRNINYIRYTVYSNARSNTIKDPNSKGFLKHPSSNGLPKNRKGISDFW